MLLSYRSTASAGSALDGFNPSAAVDENPRSFWVAEANTLGQWLKLDLGRIVSVRAAQVNFADYQAERYDDAPDIYTQFHLEYSQDGENWLPLAETGPEKRDRPNAYFEFPSPVRARFIRYVHGHVGARRLAISDLRVFGHSGEANPERPTRVAAMRMNDQRDAQITWRASKGAIGYNILWGIRPDRLTLTYQIFADTLDDPLHPTKMLRALNVGQGYYFAVEAFNRNGVSRRSEPVRLGR